MKFILITLFVITFVHKTSSDEHQCSKDKISECEDENSASARSHKSEKYSKESNIYQKQIRVALDNYKPCVEDDVNCICHAQCIEQDLLPFQESGITGLMLENSAKYGTRYKIFNHRLYRDADCMFPARCSGVEHFLLRLMHKLPNMDLIINTRDWPQLYSASTSRAVVFSFSKTSDYSDIIYPAWTFWEGGPAISLYPTGIGRWDIQRETISNAMTKTPWSEKLPKGFFRGSRTSDERDSLVLLSRRVPNLVDAQYTKNQAWKSLADTLNAEPAKEVSFEEHCKYKYLFNFRGVAASFRLKHILLCKSLVFHVGDEWNEFFYFAMKPWVHYVPLKKYPSELELEEILRFFQLHDELAKEIAERGYNFIWQHLRMQDVECYWKKLLVTYQKLLKYNVEANKELIEIKKTKNK